MNMLTRLRELTCPLCGAMVPRGQVLAHRLQVHGESASGGRVINAKLKKSTKGKRKPKKRSNIPSIGVHPTLISQLHKSQYKRNKAISITGSQSYQPPKDWNAPRA